MHPYRPPFGGPARPTNPNTTQPQTPYNLQDMDPSFLSYAAYLSGAPPFVSPTYGFGQAGGSQPSQPEPESEPDVEVVPESQPEPVQDKSKRGRRSHKKKEKDEPRRAKTTIKWTKDEEYTLTRAWLDISEDEDTANFQTGPVFWDRVRALFYSSWGQGEHRDKDSISSKWTDINNKCHAFQEVYQRNYDNRPSGESDVGVLTKTLEEFDRTKSPFTYYKCWELLRKSPKWALVNPMTTSSRRRAKRSKTSSSADPSTPTSDARNVDLNETLDVDEQFQDELARPTGRRKGTGKKTVESSSDLGLKDDFEEMNRRLQDIHDLGHKRWEIMKDRVVETKKFNELQEARQMEKDIEFLSKPIDHLQGDALILAQMRRQKIREKYGL
ncbi:putative glutathione transferase [Helianthus annuus]|uniref:glutathione S-transferase T3-like isoform X1 n=1 Tax=Helianthus annuus TaxID=4232 RepID=UPI000B8F2091|nr:glutathione S-transferase T3-like isoform X1 [Helianthus annuus]XP_021978444.1 glutathione S-transferase T3-like isoform X1 [Helianthus annuus]XP_021983070.1 glutathione S-transferase T3-like isoform X1 [Helianthus annuus]XP_021990067.1 glutathione S-transferase T3-like isoform X1 [Helianthus annuus]XP_022000997.1 glutathione S-transferase T3-like isoform X1 [Helianthus annuus]XP_022015737.1 glutathione S-transferase T3-like isoform X1 [Helianthus annuus]XP_022028401.1 glutathione S-transf